MNELSRGRPVPRRGPLARQPQEELRSVRGVIVPFNADSDCMQIILEVSISPTGRLTGWARRAGQDQQTAFSGTMELTACIESLCDSGPEIRARAGHDAP